jgi:molybdopterin synthase sulfur carrier subunit
MKIELRLFASLTRYLPEAGASAFSNTVEVEEGITVEALMDRLGIPREQPKIIFVNGRHAQPTHILQEGDRLGIFPPLAGG